MGYEGDLFSVLKHRIFRKKYFNFEKDFVHHLGGERKKRLINYLKLARKLILPQKTVKGKKVWDMIMDRGHEFGFHGYIHVKWHSLSKNEMQKEYDQMFRVYKSIYGNKNFPEGLSSPLDNCSRDNLDLIDSLGFKYASILKGKNPFHPIIDGHKYHHLQIPITVTSDGHPGSSLFSAYISRKCSKETWMQNLNKQIQEQLQNNQLISVYMHDRNIFSYKDLLIDFLELMKETSCKNKLFKEIARGDYPSINYHY